ncbi:putative NAD(P)H quinone oxidoreductase, PIG3 family [Serratia fonticola]|uniref:Putative NAD(P)H quinone oxidoreductase, PIG3 family n=1 Tax=Serratia fonticola TaxID=47917 RepID=A0A4U9W6F3_SERFO|nr:putative NAD(P)H quinone oxidoreductase, PIG3 family [Serratia fonticola]
MVERGHLRAGESVLVQAPVALPCSRYKLPKPHGAEVFITSGSEEKLLRAKALGADHGIHRLQGDWVESIYQLTQDRGIDHIVETVVAAI